MKYKHQSQLTFPALAGRRFRLHLKARLHATAFGEMTGVDAVLVFVKICG